MTAHTKHPWGLACCLLSATLLLNACSRATDTDAQGTAGNTSTALSANDIALSTLITARQLDADTLTARGLPNINDPLPQLGKKLFFSKSLGGNFDSACVSCHHPMLGGADDLSLSIGVDAIDPDLLGIGRVHATGAFPVPRNAPTVFNVGLWDSSLFWDSRVESQGKEPQANGSNSGIRTPDSSLNMADTNAGANLAAAQARFPVTSPEEMKTDDFESGSSNQTIRDHLAARIGGYGSAASELSVNTWLAEFQTAFGASDTAENLITFDNIAHAIGEYERSMVFINSPWQRYVNGDTTALNDTQKRGALLFFNPTQNGGKGCVACHSGALFSDEQHHTVAFPQIGPGKGDGLNGTDDFGRQRETGNTNDRYRFRTPGLLNIATSAPYGHAGSYATLADVVRHYRNPQQEVTNYFNNREWCNLPQFSGRADCATLNPDGATHSQLALNKLRQEQQNQTSRLPANLRISETEVTELVAFLEALTDPCVEDRTCMAPWIANTATDNHDNQILIATDQNGTPL